MIYSQAENTFAKENIIIATHDQAPYGTYLENKTFDGLAVRVMNCVISRMGKTASIQVYPWTRAQDMAERGEVDGFFPATLKPDRLAWAEVTKKIADQKWVWYMPIASKLDPKSESFKKSAKVGAHMGSNRLKFLQENHYNIIVSPHTDDLLLKTLVAGNTEAILGGNLSIAEVMKNQNINPKDYKTVLEKDAPLFAYFGKKFLNNNPGFIKKFNVELPYCFK